MAQIVLDAEAFKALASDTRLQILKALDARPLTVSELSRLLALNKATVFEHLRQLMSADLVKKDENPTRKWVYYRLTWKGRNVLHPENAQIFLMLGLAALGSGGALVQAGLLIRSALESRSVTDSAPAPPSEGPRQEVAAQDAQQAPAGGSASPSPEPSQVQTSGGGLAPEPVESQESGGPGYEFFTSSGFLLMAALVVLLALVALIAWTLYRDQLQERRVALRLIESLPAGLNEAEEKDA